jgi:hypothetical protein
MLLIIKGKNAKRRFKDLRLTKLITREFMLLLRNFNQINH